MSDKVRKYACIMIKMPPKLAAGVKSFQKSIRPEELIPEEADGGLEDDIHVTLIYGVFDAQQTLISSALSKLQPFALQIGPITSFETSPEHDVLKFDIVESPMLHSIHNAIKAIYPNDQKYDEFKPHMTIAYLKKGSAQKYTGVGNDITGRVIMVKHIIWSNTESQKSTIKLSEAECSHTME